MNITKIVSPVIQNIDAKAAMAAKKLTHTVPQTLTEGNLKGLEALSAYNKPLASKKVQNTVKMKLVKDGYFKGFEFFDGDKRIGRAVLNKTEDTFLSMKLPESWYQKSIQKGIQAKPKPFCFVSEIVMDDMCDMQRSIYAKRTGGKKYGTMCMQKILDWAQENGCGTRIMLEPSYHGSNVHPGEFYAKIGFDLEPGAKAIRSKGDARRIAKGFPPLKNYDGRYISSGEAVVLTNPEVLINYLNKA